MCNLILMFCQSLKNHKDIRLKDTEMDFYIVGLED